MNNTILMIRLAGITIITVSVITITVSVSIIVSAIIAMVSFMLWVAGGKCVIQLSL